MTLIMFDESSTRIHELLHLPSETGAPAGTSFYEITHPVDGDWEQSLSGHEHCPSALTSNNATTRRNTNTNVLLVE